MKINLVLALRNRIHKICHPIYVGKNIKIIYNILLDNGYPKWFLNKFLFNSIDNITHNRFPNQNSTNFQNLNISPEISAFYTQNNQYGGISPDIFPTQNDQVINPDSQDGALSQDISAFLTQNQKFYYFSLPYCQGLTQKLEKTLTPLFGIRICGKHVLKIQNTFSRLKDIDEPIKMSNVVYSIKCLECNGNYIGQTSTVLKDRLTRHKSDCRLGKNSCALAEHVINTNHNIDFENVKVINNEQNSNKRKFLEMVGIVLDSDCLNKKKDVEDLSVIYSHLLSGLKQRNNHAIN